MVNLEVLTLQMYDSWKERTCNIENWCTLVIFTNVITMIIICNCTIIFSGRNTNRVIIIIVIIQHFNTILNQSHSCHYMETKECQNKDCRGNTYCKYHNPSILHIFSVLFFAVILSVFTFAAMLFIASVSIIVSGFFFIILFITVFAMSNFFTTSFLYTQYHELKSYQSK